MNTTAERIIQIVTPLSDVVELLVLGCPADDANLYAQTLRNSGMVIHLSTVNTQDELDRLLDSGKADVVLVNCDAEEIDFTTAIRQIRKQCPQAAFILLSDDPGSELFFAAETGAQDIIERHDHAHLIYVINREQQNMITKRKLQELESRAREAEERWSLLIQSSEEAIAYIHEGMHIHANPAYLSLFGYENADEIEGLPFMDLIASEDRLKFKPVLRLLEKKHTAENITIGCVTHQGEVLPVEMRFAPTRVEGEECTQVIVTDQSVPPGLRVRPEDLANYDTDTGLYNRKYFLEQLEEHLQRATADDHGLGLVTFNITNLKEIRAEAGDDPGNQLVRRVARFLNEEISESDLLARYGEHEFSLLCSPGTDTRSVATRLLEKLQEQEFGISPKPKFVAGVAQSDEPKVGSAHELLHHVTLAWRKAMADSKDLIVFEQEQFSQAGDERNVNDKLIQLIDEALEHGERFLPLYQPMVSLHGNSREDYVVYLRLRDDENNLLMPDEFMPSAARADRMAEIDRWIIRRAIQEVAERRKQGERLNFLINLSAEGIADDSLLLWVCDCLREFKAKGAWLTFIVSQQDVMRNLEQMEQLSEGLRQINCRIALSHFSFEQEAVNLVKHLSPNMVCFETDTAANIARNKEHRAMLSDYNEQLQKEGVKTVVTNIEEAAQLTLLWNIGVNYIQGNFIQEPVESIVYDAEL